MTTHSPVFGYHAVQCVSRGPSYDTFYVAMFIVDGFGECVEMTTQHLYQQEAFYAPTNVGREFYVAANI